MDLIELTLKVLTVLGYISTVIVLITFILAVVFCVKGFFPVLIRLGKGLWKRRIAIFSKSDTFTSLRSLLIDSKLFKSKNILNISTTSDIGRAENETIFLVYWPDWKEDIERILNVKKDRTALVIYAPHEHGQIPGEILKELESHRNVVVNNFRGRLLNDVIVSMITTGYQK